MEEMKKAIVLPDIHHPYHNKKAWLAVLNFIKWFVPDIVVLLGDAMDMRSVDHWKKEKGNLRHFEGLRLLHDYKDFSEDILKPIEEAVPNARKIYMGGNHEIFVERVLDENPQLVGMVEPETVLKLEERKWEWIPYLIKQKRGGVKRGMLKLGKLTLVHGEYTNKFHASKTADSYLKSVMYAHTHDLQLFTKVTVEDPNDYHSCQSIGCLCDRSPMFLWGRPNRWVHAFAVIYFQDNGNFNAYIPVIVNGKFVFEGKVFSF
ncbi:MAG: hypothetical protein H7831_09960 [Magnetococcus sp. WYHC-3]